MNDKYKKIAGTMFGGAIGDALGFPIEFERGIKSRQYTRFMRKGYISDDTQMSLFTANALLWNKTRKILKGASLPDTEAIYYGYLDWLETQAEKVNNNSICWIKNINELWDRRAPGNTCLMALSSGIMGTMEEPINNSKGCGNVMRIAPIALYANSLKEAGDLAAEASAITHGHPLGIIPSIVLSDMIYLIVNEGLSIMDSLKKSLEELKKYPNFPEEDIKTFLDLVDLSIELSTKNIDDSTAIKSLGEGWVAEEAFAISLYSSLKYQNSFEDAIICSVNHDGDSDSTGAITGNIMGASLGIDSINTSFLEDLELKDTILELARDLSRTIDSSIENDKEWLDKYLYLKKN